MKQKKERKKKERRKKKKKKKKKACLLCFYCPKGSPAVAHWLRQKPRRVDMASCVSME